MSYGPLPNLKLLLFYGFALPANPSDTVLFSFEVDRPLILSAALAFGPSLGVLGLYARGDDETQLF